MGELAADPDCASLLDELGQSNLSEPRLHTYPRESGIETTTIAMSDAPATTPATEPTVEVAAEAAAPAAAAPVEAAAAAAPAAAAAADATGAAAAEEEKVEEADSTAEYQPLVQLKPVEVQTGEEEDEVLLKQSDHTDKTSDQTTPRPPRPPAAR